MLVYSGKDDERRTRREIVIPANREREILAALEEAEDECIVAMPADPFSRSLNAVEETE